MPGFARSIITFGRFCFCLSHTNKSERLDTDKIGQSHCFPRATLHNGWCIFYCCSVNTTFIHTKDKLIVKQQFMFSVRTRCSQIKMHWKVKMNGGQLKKHDFCCTEACPGNKFQDLQMFNIFWWNVLVFKPGNI